MKKINVLIVDDSAVVRKILTQALSKDPEIEVIGSAPDPYIARDMIIQLKPDVITLDVEMPRMDGITFLQKLMKYYPIPVVMVSSLTEPGVETAIKAMEIGALDCVAKPPVNLTKGISFIINELITKIKVASQAKLKVKLPSSRNSITTRKNSAFLKSTNKVIAIGSSTGGTEALKEVLTSLPTDIPGIAIVQHMPEKFTRTLAERLNNLCQIEVKEARDGDSLVPGTSLIAPGNYHMELKRKGSQYYIKLHQGERVFHQRPSVEILFNSVAKYAASNAIGVILTGMGADGAKGLLNMRKAGASTIAQDEVSCVVFGMPKEAIKIGAAEKVCSLEDIPQTIISMV